MRRFERRIRNKLKAWGCTNKAYLNWRTQHTKALNAPMRGRGLTNPGYYNYLRKPLTVSRNFKGHCTGVTHR